MGPYKFGRDSKLRFRELCPQLQEVFEVAIKYYDFKIIEGYRGKVEQNAAFESGASRVKWPDSYHNRKPSRAADIYPWPIENVKTKEYEDRCRYMAGHIMAVAQMLGYRVKWGGDWDQDLKHNDQKLNDLVHFQYEGFISGSEVN